LVVGDVSVVVGDDASVVVIVVVVVEEFNGSMFCQRKICFSSGRISFELKYKFVSYKMNKEISKESEITEIRDEL
jgi:hypothetical protein